MENRFNLLDEPWIPVEGSGKVSLRDIFLNASYTGIGGNPIQKMAVYKLLFLIAQSACDIKDEEELERKGTAGIAFDCVEYLEKHRDSFYLYGDKPLLQYPEIGDVSEIPYKNIYANYMPGLLSENDSILTQNQTMILSDADRALLLIMLVTYSTGGKQTTEPKKICESSRYSKFLINKKDLSDGRGPSAKPSPCLGNNNGFVQSLILGENILKTIQINFYTNDDIIGLNLLSLERKVSPPWERMPDFMPSEYNEAYKKSFIAWFIPLNKAVLLTEDNKVKYCEALCYTGNDYWMDPFLTIRSDNRKVEVDILKRPWNQVQALLTEVYNRDVSKQKCIAIREHYLRARKLSEAFSIWCGGLSFNSNSGEQFVKGKDDYLESSVTFSSEVLGELFFESYCNIIAKVNDCGISLKNCITAYKKQMGNDKSNNNGMFSFWYEMGKLSEDFVTAAENASEAEKDMLFKNIHKLQRNIYDDYCPHGTARQILAWAKNRP